MALSHGEHKIHQGIIIRTSWRRGGKKEERRERVGIEKMEDSGRNEQRETKMRIEGEGGRGREEGVKREREVNQCEEHGMKENEKPERERGARSVSTMSNLTRILAYAQCYSISVNMTFLFVTYHAKL